MKKLYEQKWWMKLFKKEAVEKKTSSMGNIQAVLDFLDEAHQEISSLKPLVKQIEELEEERVIATEDLVVVNLQTQAEILDKILGQYEFFQNDADINGIRVKRMASAFLNHAKEAGLHELVKKKLEDKKWAEGW